MTIRKLVLVLAVLVAAYQFGVHGRLWGDDAQPSHGTASTGAELPSASAPGNPDVSQDVSQNVSERGDAISEAYRQHRSNVQVASGGTVAKMLSDDNEGSRHQRFIVKLPSGHTVLIAHNIDLAGRVESLHEGDSISFSGEYEWNDRGGVVHWTHRDPSGHHQAGWLEHNGHRYQ